MAAVSGKRERLNVTLKSNEGFPVHHINQELVERITHRLREMARNVFRVYILNKFMQTTARYLPFDLFIKQVEIDIHSYHLVLKINNEICTWEVYLYKRYTSHVHMMTFKVLVHALC